MHEIRKRLWGQAQNFTLQKGAQKNENPYMYILNLLLITVIELRLVPNHKCEKWIHFIASLLHVESTNCSK